MSTITRTHMSDLRGAARLAFDATLGITTLVEKMHHTIQLVHPPLGASRADSTRGLTGLIYRSIRGTTRVIGKGLDAGLAPVAALLPEGVSTTSRNAWVSALNGIYGDHLERTANPLALEMCLLHEGDLVDPEQPGAVIQAASSKVLLAIHGLCLNEQHWARDGHHRIASTAAATGHTIVHLRYNSGRSIDANGRSLAALLQELIAHWPAPVTELAIVGHSMGGLVARSALHQGALAGQRWVQRVDDAVFLGTPHHGAPLERAGHGLDIVLGGAPYAAPLARLGRVRSAGINNLRHGQLLAGPNGAKPEPVPLPEQLRCFAVAASTDLQAQGLKGRLLGDGLVQVDSALGRHREPARRLHFAADRQLRLQGVNHMQLLSNPEVCQALLRWLR
jgi:pimeloyl-ACP methyl ester carboxylesterase